MEKTIKLRSNFLNSLNETLQKLSINENVNEIRPVIVEADGKFTSVIKTDMDFNPNDFNVNIDTEEDEVKDVETKQYLLNKATDALKQTVKNSKELDEILTKIKKLNTDVNENSWTVNDEKNTAILKSKNAHIFKQNNNICLSHNGKIELFKTVKELHDWLKENNYPIPNENVIIHESLQETDKKTSKRLANPEFLSVLLKNTNEIEDTPTATQECFAGTAVSNLGSAVQYTGNKTKKETTNKKSAWLNKLVGTRLVEDDTPADFAKGSPISNDIPSGDTKISSDMNLNTPADTTSSDKNITSDDLDFTGDLDMDSGPEGNTNFGDINISGGGYMPDDLENTDEITPVKVPEYQIIDVLTNENNPDDIKVKIRNKETNKIEIKDFYEIDV